MEGVTMAKIDNVGIVSYGSYIPRFRIKISDIANAWGKNSDDVINSLGVKEKTVPAPDEDSITLAVNSTRTAIENFKGKLNIGAIYTGSESHPYAVKSSSSVIGEALGIDNNYTAADLEFACKAGSAAIQMISGMIGSGLIEYGIAIGSDTAQSKPADALEFSASAAATSFILGGNEKEIIAKLLYTSSYTTDTPDFWRRERQSYPKHAGRFTGEPAYFKHVAQAITNIIEESNFKISDFNHIVLHMPNAAFPKKMASMFKIEKLQLEKGFVVPLLGNSYSASSLTGLSSIIDNAKPGDKILMCSYGSGSGSDAFIWEVTENITKFKQSNPLNKQIDNKIYIDYQKYLNTLKMIKYD
jgi:hydroxymethylglutaryl-CoA synthase